MIISNFTRLKSIFWIKECMKASERKKRKTVAEEVHKLRCLVWLCYEIPLTALFHQPHQTELRPGRRPERRFPREWSKSSVALRSNHQGIYCPRDEQAVRIKRDRREGGEAREMKGRRWEENWAWLKGRQDLRGEREAEEEEMGVVRKEKKKKAPLGWNRTKNLQAKSFSEAAEMISAMTLLLFRHHRTELGDHRGRRRRRRRETRGIKGFWVVLILFPVSTHLFSACSPSLGFCHLSSRHSFDF